ncbi:MAG: hypothetical protein WBV41_05245 [Terriglobales bacterium]
MGGRSASEISQELNRLMLERIESLRKETFVGMTPDEMHRQEERLKRIRQVSADFLAALKREEKRDEK